MKRPLHVMTEDTKKSLEGLRKKVANKYGIDKIYPASARYFPSYTIMVAIVSCLQVFVVLYGGQFFDLGSISISTGWFFLLPIVQYIFQIVTEVYGWEYARQLVLCNFICNGLATLVYFAFHLVEFSARYGNADPFLTWSHLYNVGLSAKYIPALSLWIGMFISDYVTCLLMSWSKFHMQGKYILLRVAILHIVSELLLQFGGVITDTIRGMSIVDNMHLLIDSMLGRTIVMIILLPVATWIIRFLQYNVERVVVCDVKRDLSPFKFKITQFDSFYVSSDEIEKKESVNKMFDKRDMKEMLELYKKEFGTEYKAG